MGIFGDAIFNTNIKKIKETARANGLYEGTHSENCEKCSHAVRGKCTTGLACGGRTFDNGEYMVVPASYVCEHFSLVPTL